MKKLNRLFETILKEDMSKDISIREWYKDGHIYAYEWCVDYHHGAWQMGYLGYGGDTEYFWADVDKIKCQMASVQPQRSLASCGVKAFMWQRT